MIRWNASAVMDCCDEAETELAKARPFLDKALPHIEAAARLLANVRQVDNMPQYITQPLAWAEDGVKSDYKRFVDSIPGAIQTIRDKVPANEAARTRYKGKPTSLFKVDPRLPKRTVAQREVQRYKQWEYEQAQARQPQLPLKVAR